MSTAEPDRFAGVRFPILAALATHTARPSALGKVLVGAGLLGALGWVSVTDRHRFVFALCLEGMMALLVALIAPLVAAQQVFADRQSGALDQQRLAGRTPREMLAAYALGPSWALLALLAVSTVAAVICANAEELPRALAIALGATAAGAAWTVGGVALALGLDRSLPVNQAGGVGLLGPLMRFPLYGVVLGTTRDHGWVGLIAFELLALVLATRFSLRRLAREEDDLDRTAFAPLATTAAAAVAVSLGAADMRQSPRALAFPVVAAVLLSLFAAWATTPSRGAIFRAWIADGDGTERRMRAMSALGAASAGAAVLLSRLVAGVALDLSAVTAALLAATVVGALSAVRALRWTAAPQHLANRALFAVILLPSASWIASRLAPSTSDSPLSALTRAVGAPLGGSESVMAFTLRATACIAAIAVTGWLTSRWLRSARRAAEARAA